MQGIIRSVSTSTAVNGSAYAVFSISTLEDNTVKNVNINVWGIPSNFNANSVGKVLTIINIKEKNGFLSAVYPDIAVSFLEKDSPLNSLVKKLPEKKDWDKVKDSLIAQVENPVWKVFLEDQFEKLFHLYSLYPAAKTNHHAYPGGLMEHVLQMLDLFDGMLPRISFKMKPEYVIIGILYHDYGKISEYKNGNSTEEMFLLGHIYMSAHVLQQQLMQNTTLSMEEIKRAIHPVLAHHSKLEWGSPVAPATLEAFLVHHIDMISGHGFMYDAASHMESVRNLNTTIIK